MCPILNDERVTLRDGDSLTGRLGIAAQRERSWLDEAGSTRRVDFHTIANLNYEFLDGTRVGVSGTPLTSHAEPLTGGIGFGGSYNWNDDAHSLYGTASARTNLSGSFAKSYELETTIGFRRKW